MLLLANLVQGFAVDAQGRSGTCLESFDPDFNATDFALAIFAQADGAP